MASAKAVRRCHYEVLGVDRDAEDDAIKKAYRKAALKHHPDKNVGNEDSAALEFRLVQDAYETLSDPQERSWYDDHRDAILKGRDVGRSSDAQGGDDDDDPDADFCVPLFHLFTNEAFEGFGDKAGGFFQVYREAFNDIYESERDAFEEANPSKCFDSFPSFGKGSTPWPEVMAFYSFFEMFNSVLSFAWRDLYDIRAAPDRRAKRMAEDENKKVRRVWKRKYVDSVVALTAFVKKRDPRYKKYLDELGKEKAEREATKKVEEAKKREAAREAIKKWKEEQEAEQEAEYHRKLESGEYLYEKSRPTLLYSDDEEDGKRGGKGKKKKGKNRGEAWKEEEKKKKSAAASAAASSSASSSSPAAKGGKKKWFKDEPEEEEDEEEEEGEPEVQPEVQSAHADDSSLPPPPPSDADAEVAGADAGPSDASPILPPSSSPEEPPDLELMQPEDPAACPPAPTFSNIGPRWASELSDEAVSDLEASALAAKEGAAAASASGDDVALLASLNELLAAEAALDRLSSASLARRAEVLLRLRMPAAAREDGERAIELNPDSARALKTRGLAKRFLGDYAGAAADIGDAQKIDYDGALRPLQEFLANRVATALRVEAERRRKEEEDKVAKAKERLKAHKKARKEHLRATGVKVESSSDSDDDNQGVDARGANHNKAATATMAEPGIDVAPKSKGGGTTRGQSNAEKGEVDDMLEFLEQDEVDFWRCDCCRKTFKSQAQYDQHVKSKKHKELEKKFAKMCLDLEDNEDDSEQDGAGARDS